MPARARTQRLRLEPLGVLALLLVGCGHGQPPARPSTTWIVGCSAPAFDPDGPRDDVRWALERQLSLGLTERDSGGQVTPGIADSIGCSSDSLTWTFRLRAGLKFTDGTPVTSTHVREALVGGLARADHATRAWLLVALAGVDKVRAGRKLPRLGIDTPNVRTLVLELARPDRLLLEKLALPGVSAPWKHRDGGWGDAVGVGPYHVVAADGGHSLTLVGGPAVAHVAAIVETLYVRFAIGAPRVRSLLRQGRPDTVWPLPPGLLARPLPPDWSLTSRPARPARRLLLVLRADVPPLTRPQARGALARAINREELLAALGSEGVPLRRWLPGATTEYEWPRLEGPEERQLAGEARRATRPGRRTESYQVVLAFDADRSGAGISRALQGQWARAGHYAELRPLRGAAAQAQALAATAAQAQLVVSQALLPGAEAELAQLVMPLRGPAVGSFRTGWRTRDLDRWVAVPQPDPGLDPDAVQRQLESDRVVLPIAALPWQVAFRIGVPQPLVHPAYGPGWTAVNSAGEGARTR